MKTFILVVLAFLAVYGRGIVAWLRARSRSNRDKKIFRYNGTDADVVVPKGVEIIGKSAFESCSSLKEVTIPSTVKHIGEYAFTGTLAM